MVSPVFPLLLATSALVLSTTFGALFIHWYLRLARQILPWPLIIGIGLPLGLTLATVALRTASLFLPSLQLASWVVFGVMLLSALILYFRLATARESVAASSSNPAPLTEVGEKKLNWVGIGACAIAALHFALGILNNTTRDIFPWDAFTTWMYRAKAWVLDDRFTPIVNARMWIDSGGQEGIPVYASHYPTLVSDIATWMSALSGNWYPGAASLPWSAAGIALTLAVFGLLRSADLSWQVVFFGALMATSLPLLDMHLALAGYGDIWIALTSGVGLSLTLLWASKPEKPATAKHLMDAKLWLGVVLLLIGSQIKLEGWLWLALGLFFAGLSMLSAKTLLGVFLVLGASLIAYVGITDATSLDLGPLGLWGIAEDRIHIGFLGAYGLRPYNPLPDYFDALFLQKNLSLLFLFFTIALVYMAWQRHPVARHHWLMGLMIAGSQGVIFGLSSFSQYAESGTAITRLVLHFVPIFILTSLVAAQTFLTMTLRGQQSDCGVNEDTKNLADEKGISIAATSKPAAILLLGSLAVSAVIVIVGTGGWGGATSRVSPDGMDPIVGNGALTASGSWTFTDSPQSVGVLRSLQPPPKDTRFIAVKVTGDSAREAIFYWFDKRHPNTMNRRDMIRRGSNVFDMAPDESWAPDYIGEWGLVVSSRNFSSTALGEVMFSKSLTWATLPGVFGEWLQPLNVTQRTLNNLGALVQGVPTWQSVTLFAGIILVMLVWLGPATTRLPSLAGFVALWVASDLLWLQSYGVATVERSGGNKAAMTARDEGDHLLESLEDLKVQLQGSTPVIILPASSRYNYEAQRLPYLLLPMKSTFLKASINRVPLDWSGSVLVYGERPEERTAKLQRLAERLGRNPSRIAESATYSLLQN